MLYETKDSLSELNAGALAHPVTAPLPPVVALTRQAMGELRAYLDDRGLCDYRIFHCSYHDLYDIDHYVAGLGESARWETHATGDADPAEPLALLTRDEQSARLWPGGFLRLSRFHVVLARWHWLEKNGNAAAQWLIAAPSAEHYFRLHRDVEARRHASGAAVWQVRGAPPPAAGGRPPRDRRCGEDLLLNADIRSRIETEVIRFFDAEVAALYREMNVPYRRGVLLHGAPGNGKTSTIRHIGAALPQVPAMILRPAANFDSDDLEAALDRWRRQAPALLVIEDLNWLLQAVNVSTFLNLIDGVDSHVTGGLLLIATTNHPDQLDPAVNNRPGRFDVVIEVPCPDRALRAEFFRRKWGGADAASIEKIAAATDRLSFAHLQEILRLSGLFAIQAGRRGRTIDDLMHAAKVLRGTQDDATRGFAARPEVPFGLAGWRNR
jgi:hypothetical protein